MVMQNAENVVVTGDSRSSSNVTILYSAHDFLFNFNRNYAAILYLSLAVLGPRVGHTMGVLSPFIYGLCRYD